MTLRPPDDLLQRVIFEPQHVSQSAWIVTINFVLYAMHSKETEHASSSMSVLAPSFRNNARLALDDANVYLSPSEANIQALLLLASHGDEFASPNLSWMLLGHACRQAQALGLHQPDSEDEGTRQRQLCLFWALFMVDKSCALAFGRPCFLPTRLYGEDGCEMPDDEHLQKYRPHLGGMEQAGRMSVFGMHFFKQSLEMARVAGRILDLYPRGSDEDALVLQGQLAACHEHTQQVSCFPFYFLLLLLLLLYFVLVSPPSLLYSSVVFYLQVISPSPKFFILIIHSSWLPITPASCQTARRSRPTSSSWASRPSNSSTCTCPLSCCSGEAPLPAPPHPTRR